MNSSNTNEKILITGGTGFLGSHTAIKLNNLGYEVTVSGRKEKSDASLLNNEIKYIQLDITNEQQVRKSIINFDYVIHCAALASPFGPYQSFYNANVVGTKNIINAVLNSNTKRLIYISTPSVYFDFTDKLSIKETDALPKTQYSHYAQTKHIADNLIRDAFHKKQLPVVSLRPRAIFGPGDQTITPRILKSKIFGRIPLIKGGNAIHDFTYVGNVVDAIVLSLKSNDKTLGKFYNITNDEPINLKNWFELLFTAYNLQTSYIKIPYFLIYNISVIIEFIYYIFKIKKEPPITSYAIGLFSNSQSLDISMAKEDLGYRPKITLKEGLKLTSKDSNVSK